MNLYDTNNCKIINEKMIIEMHVVDSSDLPDLADYREAFENVLYVMTHKNYNVQIIRDK